MLLPPDVIAVAQINVVCTGDFDIPPNNIIRIIPKCSDIPITIIRVNLNRKCAAISEDTGAENIVRFRDIARPNIQFVNRATCLVMKGDPFGSRIGRLARTHEHENREQKCENRLNLSSKHTITTFQNFSHYII